MDLAIGFVEDALEWTGFGVRNHLGSKKNWREFPLWGDSPSCVFEIAFFRNVFFLCSHNFALFFCVRTFLFQDFLVSFVFALLSDTTVCVRTSFYFYFCEFTKP